MLMDFVVVGNPGNSFDPATNSGKVEYAFEIGK